jgi:hypothetical protein
MLLPKGVYLSRKKGRNTAAFFIPIRRERLYL